MSIYWDGMEFDIVVRVPEAPPCTDNAGIHYNNNFKVAVRSKVLT